MSSAIPPASFLSLNSHLSEHPLGFTYQCNQTISTFPAVRTRGEGLPSIPGLYRCGSFLTEQHSLRLNRTTATGDASTSSEMSLLGSMRACNLSHPALETVGPIRLTLPLPSLPWLSIPNAGVSQVLCTSRYFYKDPLAQRVA